MKTCPQCGTRYSDDTLSFCLQDGTPLVGQVTENPTVFLGEAETAASRRDAVRVTVGDPDSGNWGQSQVTQVAPVKPEKKAWNTALAVLLTAVGMLVLFGIVGVVAIVFFRNSQLAGVQNTDTTPSVNIRVRNGNDNLTPPVTASPTRSASSTPKPPPSPSPTVDVDLPPPPAGVPYPSTTRLKFGRGAYSTSFGGLINPNDSRSLVLACRSGQSLSANVSSPGSCVTIRGGGSSFSITTSGGDNYITLSNNCSSIVKFSIRITVI
jgi:hypothetical protein